MCVNNLLKVVTQQRSNSYHWVIGPTPYPLDHRVSLQYGEQHNNASIQDLCKDAF